MTHDERIEFVKRHILNYIPPMVHGQGAVGKAVTATAEEIVAKWEDELEELGMQGYSGLNIVD